MPTIDSDPPDRVELALVDRGEFDAVLSRLKGKVVLVDCWATWCGPCVEQLPHSIDLAERYADQGLAVVTLSLDEPDGAEQVRGMLGAIGSQRTINLQSEFGSGQRSVEEFDITGGALPHYKLYDRSGNLRRTFEIDPAAARQFTTDDIDAAVVELLAE